VYNIKEPINQGNNMTKKLKTPNVYDRVRLACPGRNLAIEYIDGTDELAGKYYDTWRLIDLDTGEVFAKDVVPHEVLSAASEMTRTENDSSEFEYIREARQYRLFKDLPLKERMRYILSHAQDLEKDFNNDGVDADPIEVATQEMNDMYNETPCFYHNPEKDEWVLDSDIC